MITMNLEVIFSEITQHISALQTYGVHSLFIAIEQYGSVVENIHTMVSGHGQDFLEKNDLIQQFANLCRGESTDEDWAHEFSLKCDDTDKSGAGEVQDNVEILPDCEIIPKQELDDAGEDSDGCRVMKLLKKKKLLAGSSKAHEKVCKMKERCPESRADDVKYEESTIELSDSQAVDPSSSYKCHVCFKPFPDQTSLKQHMLYHMDRDYIECEICIKRFESAAELAKHTCIPIGKRSYLCGICNKHFHHKGHYDVHMLHHTQARPFICPLCENRYATKRSLDKHMNAHTEERRVSAHMELMRMNESDFKDNVRNPNIDAVRVENCSVSEDHQNSLCAGNISKEDWNLVVDKENLSAGQEIELFNCEFCRQQYNSELDLKEHVSLIHPENLDKLFMQNLVHLRKTYSCESCNKQFHDKLKHTVHMRTHTGEKPFACLLCKKRFNTNSQLNRHVIVHKEFCDSVVNSSRNEFVEKSVVDRFIGKIRLDRVLYTCEVCSKEFYDKLKYRVHIRTHTGEKPYACCVCDKKFNTRSQVNRHTTTVHCNKKTGNKNDFNGSSGSKDGAGTEKQLRHKRRIAAKNVEDPVMDGAHDNATRLCKNLNTTRKKSGRKKGQPNKHSGETSAKKMLYSCEYCYVEFYDKFKYTVHVRTHTGEKPYACIICEKRFNTKSLVNRHMSVHKCCDQSVVSDILKVVDAVITDSSLFGADIGTVMQPLLEQPDASLHQSEVSQETLKTCQSSIQYTCETCCQKFFNKSSYARHVRKHTAGEKLFECSECKKRFFNEFQLNNHLQSHTERLVDAEIPDTNAMSEEKMKMKALNGDVIEADTKKVHRCSICGKGFERPSLLERHQTLHRLQTSGERPELCTVCGKTFSTPSNLSSHMRTHIENTSFECPICPKKFRTKILVKQHLKSHNQERPFHCPLCEKRFRVNYNLKIHMLKHTGEKAFSCNMCDKRFSTRTEANRCMRKHNNLMDRSVESTKPKMTFSCPVCGKFLARSANLRFHMRIHTGEKPFVCDLCGKAFALKHALKRHFNKIHGRKLLSSD